MFQQPLGPIIIDCDTGRDDALALWLTLRLGLALKAVVTSFGNTTLENATRNSINVLDVAGRSDIPVFAGADKPLNHHAAYDSIVVPRHHAGGNGICDVQLPAGRSVPAALPAKEMAQSIRSLYEVHGPLEYIVLGPATNLALLYQNLQSDFHTIIRSIYMGGGKFEWMWDQVPGADFNVVADPYAVDILLKQAVPVHFVPMDVLFPVFDTLESILAFDTKDEISDYTRQIMQAHAERFAPQPVFRHIDPATILSILQPEGFEPQKLKINLEEDSLDFGRLIEHDDGYSSFVYQRDIGRFEKILNRIHSELGLIKA